jgi:hypothetical protein
MIRDLSKGYGGHDSHNSEQQVFDGFPYFVTRIVPALYHVILLPAGMDEGSLISFAEHQSQSNNLEACLVLSRDRGNWFTT